MAARFRQGAVAFGKDGKRYVVDEAVEGLLYCHSDNGAEVEFTEAQMMTEAEWAARNGAARGSLYDQLKKTTPYHPVKGGGIDRTGSNHLLDRAAALFPGMLDYVAFVTATRALPEFAGERFLAELSIIKCRALFDGATPETRATLLCNLVGATPERLVSAARIGDNLTRAMIEKGLDARAFEAFGTRRRQ
jgi:hypothetical protein